VVFLLCAALKLAVWMDGGPDWKICGRAFGIVVHQDRALTY